MTAEDLPDDTPALLNYLHSFAGGDSQQLATLYTQALSRLKDDRSSLQVFLEYVEIARACTDPEDIEHIYSLMKVKLRAFKEFWDSYIDFEVGVRGKSRSSVLSKVLEYLNVKVFPGKEELVLSLKREEGSGKRMLVDADESAKKQENAVFELEPLSTLKTFQSSNVSLAVDEPFTPASKENVKDEVPNVQMLKFKEKTLFRFSRIGKGGSSAVYRVLMDSEIYALKQIRVEDKEGLQACKDEIFLLEKLNNYDFVIKMIDYEITAESVGILLEYGETDLQKLIFSGSMNIFLIKYIWESVLRILEFIHSKRIVHRDIKPANFVLVKGKVKLIDFGISKSIRADTTSVLNIEKAGTLNYISPEQCTGRRVSRAADVWAAGCILYNMIYRKNVHPAKNVMDVVRFMGEERPIEYGEGDALAIECMKKCLNYDYKKRAKPRELLLHPFLHK